MEFRHLESDIPGSSGEVAVVVAAALALALLITFVPSRLSGVICLGFQRLVESFLYATAHQFLEFALDYGLV